MAATPQNLLVLMSDEHNPKIAGYAGHPIISTPALDALAAVVAASPPRIHHRRFAFLHEQVLRPAFPCIVTAPGTGRSSLAQLRRRTGSSEAALCFLVEVRR
jgi:hypothetical protein